MKAHFTSTFSWFVLFVLLLSLTGSMVHTTSAHAAASGYTINVTSAKDDDTGGCTLREAIIAANPANTKWHDCVKVSDKTVKAGTSKITFAGDNFIITLASQLPSITYEVMIVGRGAIIQADDANDPSHPATWRVFQIAYSGYLTLDKVTVRNGYCYDSCKDTGGVPKDSGGGIYNNGTLIIKNSTISENTTLESGGGIYTNGNLTVINSTISGNTSYDHSPTGCGGGVCNEGNFIMINSTISDNEGYYGGGVYNSGTMTVRGSTTSSNTGRIGGAIYNSGGTLTVTNSTFTGNSATSAVGGIAGGTVTITNSTFSGNSSPFGYGNNISSKATLKNTIVVGSAQSTSCDGTITDGGNNISYPGTTCPGSNQNPLLSSLADNGGPTQTMALQAGSPAINAGNDIGCPLIDQRGMGRPYSSHCDIGAYEADASSYVPLFEDVPVTDPYWEDIEILYRRGLTGGCATSPLRFCPDQIMDRAQAAVFMVRGAYGAGYAPSPAKYLFKDDWSRVVYARPWAEAMRETNLTTGCKASPLLYCPLTQLTREQAVIFGLKMKYGTYYQPPSATGTVFADMTNPSYYATAWAEKAYADGLIPACGSLNGKLMFCPGVLVTRGLGAYIIVRAKNLALP